MNDQPNNSDENTEFILPIVCPHCLKEISLAMLFSLLVPEDLPPQVEQIKNNEPKEEA
jgi:hypothetical protein